MDSIDDTTLNDSLSVIQRWLGEETLPPCLVIFICTTSSTGVFELASRADSYNCDYYRVASNVDESERFFRPSPIATVLF